MITLVSSNPAAATVPATVNISSFGTSVSVPVTGVAPGSATITASTTGGVGNATANITVVGTSAINVPSGVTVAPGSAANFPVTLAAPAPSGGAFVTLTSSDPNILTISPGALLFSQGSTTTVVTPKVTGVNFGTVTVTASAPGVGTTTQQVTVGAALSFQPSSIVITGNNVPKSLTLLLSAQAPAGGLTINLASSDPTVATVPPTVTIPANNTSATIVVTSVGPGVAEITASKLPVLPTAGLSVTVVAAPSVILPNFESVGVTWTVQVPVSLSSPAPAGGVTILLSSSNTSKFVVTTPSVFVPAGATTPATMPSIKAGDLFTSEGFATLTAAASGYTTATLDILVVDQITLAMPPNPTVGVGQTVPLPVALPGPAPAGGVLITLTSSDPTRLTVTPTAFVPEGSNLPATTPLMTGVNFGTANVSATSPAHISGIQTVTVNTELRFVPPSLTINGNLTGDLVLTMSGKAPAGGLTVHLISSNPGVATVPDTVFFPQNAVSVNVPVTGSGTGTATITAVPAVNAPSTIATVTRK